MATTYDIELWIPSMNEYKECLRLQRARLSGPPRQHPLRRNETKKLEFVHTLNGSGLATTALMPAIVEQFQQPDGSVIIPEKLRPYLDGMEKISPGAERSPIPRRGPRGPSPFWGRGFLCISSQGFLPSPRQLYIHAL